MTRFLLVWSAFWFGWACASEPAELRCDAVHDISTAICERAVFCGTLTLADFATCEMVTFGTICTENTCTGYARSTRAVDACADAVRELACVEVDWPPACYGAIR